MTVEVAEISESFRSHPILETYKTKTFKDGDLLTPNELLTHIHAMLPYCITYEANSRENSIVIPRKEVREFMESYGPAAFTSETNYNFRYNTEGIWYIALDKLYVRDVKYIAQLKLAFG